MKKKVILLLIILIAITLIRFRHLNVDNKTLTVEEKLEDFEFMVKHLDENYCNMDMFYHKNGIKYESLIKDFKKAIEKTSTDIEFYNLLNFSLKILEDDHVGILYPQVYREFRELESMKELPYLYNILNDSEVKEKYIYWSNLLGDTPNIQLLARDIGNKKEKKIENKNVNVNIIDKNIAYMKIESFYDPNFTQKDINTISKFYKNIDSYENLIIDIRGNGGGSSRIWMDYIVAPIINKPYISTSYSLHKAGELSMEYYESRGTSNNLKSITQFPKKELLYDLQNVEKFKYFMEFNYRVNPSDNRLSYKPDAFRGNIYLLVDDKVFSSAEAFTVFAKNSNWATIVGTNTKGDGIGIDPIFLKLPNSKLIVRFTTEKGLNQDGRNNSEFGTTPDLEIDNLGYLVDYINNQ